ncbi:MAG: TonB-dependent receptor [Parvibaculaceae bacterium]|nr:TonB-dependent receptor [Parvibaculaceae bacterium]
MFHRRTPNLSLLSTTFLLSTAIGGTLIQPAGAETTALETKPQVQSATLLPKISVSASPLTSDATQLAIPSQAVETKTLAEEQPNSLGTALGELPGVTQSGFAAGANRPIIRGLDNFRVLIQENGVPANGASALSEDHGVPINAASADRIEIIKGPATLRYGSQALGGVVNVLNNRIPSAPLTETSGSLSAGVSTVDNGHQETLKLETGADFGDSKNNISLHLDASNQHASDYEAPNAAGVEVNTATKSQSVAGGAAFHFATGYFGLSASTLDSQYGLPAPEDPNEPITIEMRETRFNTKFVLDDLGEWGNSLTATLGYTDYTHDEIEGGSVVGATFDIEEWDGRVEWLHPAIGSMEGAIGVNGFTKDLAAGGEAEELLAPTKTDSLALFLFETLPLSESLDLQMGARAEHVAVEGTAFDTATLTESERSRSFTALNASVALVQSFGEGWVTSLNGQMVQRAPDALELFAKGPHHASETFELGNADLDVETAYSAEISLRRYSSPFTFEVSAYASQFDGYIYKHLTGRTCDHNYASCVAAPTEELAEALFVQRDAFFWGAEAQAKWSLLTTSEGVFGIDGQADFVKARFSSDAASSGNVPRIPPLRYGLGLFWETDDVNARINVLRASKQTSVADNETSTKGYTLLNANITTQMQVGSHQLNIGLVGHNLLDDDIRLHSSIRKDEVLQPGRDVRLVVTAHF